MEGMEVISSYSRAEAIEDGLLVDVTSRARECGFIFPVAISQRVYAKLNSNMGLDDFEGRLWDLLSMLRFYIRTAVIEGSGNPSRVEFEVIVGPYKEKFYSVCGPGDDRKPVITIMLPEED